ncbi:MAG TPA: hypothetical protein VK453_13525 [Micromonosporaceae bacterium]|nr:hypothetical protein [Micromonosporaceae bacterium]
MTAKDDENDQLSQDVRAQAGNAAASMSGLQAMTQAYTYRGNEVLALQAQVHDVQVQADSAERRLATVWERYALANASIEGLLATRLHDPDSARNPDPGSDHWRVNLAASGPVRALAVYLRTYVERSGRDLNAISLITGLRQERVSALLRAQEPCLMNEAIEIGNAAGAPDTTIVRLYAATRPECDGHGLTAHTVDPAFLDIVAQLGDSVADPEATVAAGSGDRRPSWFDQPTRELLIVGDAGDTEHADTGDDSRPGGHDAFQSHADETTSDGHRHTHGSPTHHQRGRYVGVAAVPGSIRADGARHQQPDHHPDEAAPAPTHEYEAASSPSDSHQTPDAAPPPEDDRRQHAAMAAAWSRKRRLDVARHRVPELRKYHCGIAIIGVFLGMLLAYGCHLGIPTRVAASVAYLITVILAATAHWGGRSLEDQAVDKVRSGSGLACSGQPTPNGPSLGEQLAAYDDPTRLSGPPPFPARPWADPAPGDPAPPWQPATPPAYPGYPPSSTDGPPLPASDYAPYPAYGYGYVPDRRTEAPTYGNIGAAA